MTRLSALTRGGQLGSTRFFTLLKGLLGAAEECQASALNAEGLCLNEDLIYLDPGDARARFAYIPTLREGDGTDGCREFLRTLIAYDRVESGTLASMVAEVANDPAFSLSMLREELERYEREPSPFRPFPPVPGAQQEEATIYSPEEEDAYPSFAPSSVRETPAPAVEESSQPGGLFSRALRRLTFSRPQEDPSVFEGQSPSGSSASSVPVPEATVYMPEETGETVLLPDDVLCLRTPSGEMVPVSCSPFRLGRDPAASDYVLTDETVGRQHAQLIRQPDGGWAVIDLNSRNHTYLNGSCLTPREPYPVSSGDTLRLSRVSLQVVGG